MRPVTQFIGVIGYPLTHSISPDFQQAALDHYKLDIHYEAWEVKAEDLLPAITRLKQPQNLGANITVPYKETALQFMDEVDGFASLLGAVNTVVNRDGRLVGFNTDAYGFLKALRQDAGFESENKRAVILGAGGAARAVSLVLLQQKVSSLIIANRTPAKAERLAVYLSKHAAIYKMHAEIAAMPWPSAKFTQAVEHSQLIVNCTTLGMKHSSQEGQAPLVSGLIPKDALIYDLVYNPSETPLLKIAREAGAKTIGGLPMLVYQGAASFELWTGREAPLDIMMSAAKKALLKIGG
ncbi:MAG: shikimate dehydrogenase [Chloroflexi bacterium RBG_13_50_10]|nr:MAG: shikimate dehydrogenase [Chloroflexi bacterium RBG_13_50_10]